MERLILAAAALASVALLTTPAAAQRRSDSTIAVLSGPADVSRGETVTTLFVLEGPTRIDGTVTGDVVAVGGDVDVAGRVGGTVTALAGTVRLGRGAVVGRDVVSTRPPVLAPDARVLGSARPVTRDVGLGERLVGRVVGWLAVTVSTLLLALLLALAVPRRTADAVYDAAKRAPARALGLGLLVAVLLPAAAILAIVALLGAPLGVLFLLAIGPLTALGYVASGWMVGRFVGDRVRPALPAVVSLLVGVAVLRALALVPLAGGLVWLATTVFGVGACVVALARARRSGGTADTTGAPAATRTADASRAA